MNAVVDTDILIKSASYALMGPLVTESLGSGSVFGYLAVARFMVPKRLEAAKLRRPAVEAIDELKTWFSSSVPIETDDREQELAASLESSAQQAGVSLDQGESQLCAVLINRGIPLMLTGDKRAIVALETLAETDAVVRSLAGRVRCLEQLVQGALERNGLEAIRPQICAEPRTDKSLTLVFSCSGETTTDSVKEGLVSYVSDLRRQAERILAAN